MAWFSFLEALRAIALETPQFGSKDLADRTDLSEKDASAWISKFVRWGYAKRVGSIDNPGRKPKAVYSLTDYGLKLEPKNTNRLSRLIDAVQSYQAARGSKKEPSAFANLMKTLEDIKSKENRKD